MARIDQTDDWRDRHAPTVYQSTEDIGGRQPQINNSYRSRAAYCCGATSMSAGAGWSDHFNLR